MWWPPKYLLPKFLNVVDAQQFRMRQSVVKNNQPMVYSIRFKPNGIIVVKLMHNNEFCTKTCYSAQLK